MIHGPTPSYVAKLTESQLWRLSQHLDYNVNVFVASIASTTYSVAIYIRILTVYRAVVAVYKT